VWIPAEKIANFVYASGDPFGGSRIFRRHIGEQRRQLTRRDFGKTHLHQR
jgi:hypothetical protein